MGKLLQEFLEPSSEYTQFPFWFWNDTLKYKQIEESLKDFKAKGIDGIIIHPRIGLDKDIGYLTDTFFDYVLRAVEVAKELEMKVVLYDEGMYPSGAAHGKVVANHPELASKGLLMINKEKMEDYPFEPLQIMGEYKVEEEGYVVLYGHSGGNIRGVHIGEDDFESPPQSADLLNPETTKFFIAYTHAKYYEKLSEHFGHTIIGFFTDEPDILGRNAFPGMIPWAEGFLSKLEKEGITKRDLPLLFQKDENHVVRQTYQDLVQRTLSENYYAVLSLWCEEHQVALMGHPHGSMDIGFQEHFHIPGQDMVWRWVGPGERGGVTGKDSTAAKCSADAARHLERRRNSNEIFGCCGPDGKQWAFTLKDMKWYLDWLFIRGVNMIIPHAFFYSLKGARSEDRPPDVGPNNLWWPYYDMMARYSKRMSWLMTDAINQTNIAVLCKKDDLPFESVIPFWENQIEFNYLEEKYLDAVEIDESGFFQIGKQCYNILVVPEHIAPAQLNQFKKQGLRIVFASDKNTLKKEAIYRPSLSKKVPHIRYSHVKKSDRSFYIFSNEGEEEYTFEWELEAELIELRPLTGEIVAVPTEDGKKSLHFYPRDLKIFTEKQPGETGLEKETSWLQEVPFQYTVSADPLPLTDFQDWTTYNPAYSGEVTYNIRLSVTLDEQQGEFILDLGTVNDIVVFTSSSGKRQLLFTEPYHIPVGCFTEEGLKDISISVINSLTNRYDKQPRPSGILGPVRLYRLNS